MEIGSPPYWIVLILGNIPVYIGIGWVIFNSWSGFFECLKFWFMPDIVSLFRGELYEDWFAQMKMFFWLLVCAGVVFGEHLLITKLFGP
jgi:hypothetical protein